MELPKALTEVEGHLKWMAEAVRDFTANPQKEKSTYLLWLLAKGAGPVGYHHPFQGGEEDDVEWRPNKQNPTYARALTRHFHRCLECLVWDKLEQGRKSVEKGQQLLNNLSGEHTRLLEPMQYFLEVLEWSIDKLQDPSSSTSSPDEDDKVKEFQGKWEVLQRNAASQAVIVFVKGRFQEQLNNFDNLKYLQMLQEVIKLDPSYHMWPYYAYRSKRQTRRKSHKKKVKAPSSEERELCQTAYSLAPDLFITNYQLGLMLKDCLWMTSYYPQLHPGAKVDRCLVNVEESLEKCLQLWDKAHALALGTGPEMDEWAVKSLFNKAEVLLYSGPKIDDQRQGLELLSELGGKYPQNAYLQHKLGRIYNFGVGMEKTFRDLGKAVHHFIQSLEIRDPGNYFPFLKEFIRLWRYFPPPPPAKQTLEFLTQSLEESTNLLEGEHQTAEVRMWRGCILWIYDPEETKDHKRRACEDWVFVAENFPKLRNDLMKMIQKPPFFKYGDDEDSHTVLIDTEELKTELEGMKLEIDSSCKALEAMDYILKGVSRDAQYSGKIVQQNADRCKGQEEEGRAFGRKDKETTRRDNYRPGARNPVGKGLADQDDNWRRK